MINGHDRLILKLESVSGLSDEEIAAVRSLPLTPRQVQAGAEIVREGERPTDCCLLIDGFLVRQKILQAGRRQIMSIHTPGDFADLQSLHLRVMDHSIVSVAESTVASVPHAAIEGLTRRSPKLAEAFTREALIDAAIHREWICNVGARSAYQRTAHLFCEVFLKMDAVGLVAAGRCPLPLSQVDLADCMGLSPVHVNRTLQQLRADGLIAMSRKVLTVPDFEALQAAGEFDPTYLQLRRHAA